MSKIKLPVLVLVLLALGGLAYGGYRFKKSSEISGRAAEEAKAEEAERKECEAHLALFYKAWSQYKADNKGATPGSMQALVPKYIPDPSMLICPTAARLQKSGIYLERGNFKVDGKSIDNTYGFRWMAAGFPKLAQRTGDKTPLIICLCHQQAMYHMAYGKPVPAGAFDDASSLVPEVANAPILGVRMNGKVEPVEASSMTK